MSKSSFKTFINVVYIVLTWCRILNNTAFILAQNRCTDIMCMTDFRIGALVVFCMCDTEAVCAFCTALDGNAATGYITGVNWPRLFSQGPVTV